MKVYEHTWVVGVKDSGELKARLTCCDYNDGEEVPRTFCPTPSSTAVRVFEAVSLIKGYRDRHSDVVSASPHAPEEADVFMQAPKEWMEAHGKTLAMGCWRLVRSLYGRRTAGGNFRDFFEKTMKEVKNTDFDRCPEEPCLYRDKLSDVALLHHVDDEKTHGPDKLHDGILDEIEKQLLTKRGDRMISGSKDQ